MRATLATKLPDPLSPPPNWKKRSMTPENLKAARKAALGFNTAAKLGRALELEGKDPGRTVRLWEEGRPIPGPARVAIALMLADQARQGLRQAVDAAQAVLTPTPTPRPGNHPQRPGFTASAAAAHPQALANVRRYHPNRGASRRRPERHRHRVKADGRSLISRHHPTRPIAEPFSASPSKSPIATERTFGDRCQLSSARAEVCRMAAPRLH